MGKRLYQLELDSREAAVLRVMVKKAFLRDTDFIAKAQKDIPVFPGAQSFIDSAEADRRFYNKVYMALCHYEVLPDDVTQPDPPASADGDEVCVTDTVPDSSEPEPEAKCGNCFFAVSNDLTAHECVNAASPYSCECVGAECLCDEYVPRKGDPIDAVSCNTCRFACRDGSKGLLCMCSGGPFRGNHVGKLLSCNSWLQRLGKEPEYVPDG